MGLEAGLALSNKAREPIFTAKFDDDVLRRRVAAYVATDNLGPDAIGEQAERWLRGFFCDPDPDVRFEAALVRWETLRDRPTEQTKLAEAFLTSPAFADEPDYLMGALEDRVDRYPRLTFDAVTRVVELQQQWTAEGRPRYSRALHNLGRVLVAVYRTAEDDAALEDRILGLF